MDPVPGLTGSSSPPRSPAEIALFDDIDSMDPDGAARPLSDDLAMRFGNDETIVDGEAVPDARAAFCADVWRTPG